MKRIILHCDLDAFFCRAEEIKNPSLENEAFIVGGDGRRGIVSTCSYKAREYGIHSGMPTFQAKMLCPNIKIINSDFPFYQLLSREFFHYLKKYSSKIEPMSIDECFVDLTDYFYKNKKDIKSILIEIQQGVLKDLNLKCSIGVGTTKFIAKMASDIHKPLGITIIRNKDIEKILFPLPVKNFFGVGRKTVPRLNQIGIYTIGDLYCKAKNNDPELINTLGKFSESICDLLEGNSDDQIDLSDNDPKSIGMSRTLDYDTNEENIIIDILTKEVKSVCESLKREEKLAKTITINYKDAASETHFKQTSFSKTFSSYTDNYEYILKETLHLFKEHFNFEIIRLIGFSLKNFKNKNEVNTQLNLFNYQIQEKENKTFVIINELNREMNKEAFKKLSDLKK